MKILIVEDNKSIRRLLRLALKEIATVMQDCDDGAYALEAYSSLCPDVVLMDIRMPLRDGLEVTREIKQRYPSACILIVTDYDDMDLRYAASEAGASAYLLKDDMMELPRVIAEIVQDQGELRRTE